MNKSLVFWDREISTIELHFHSAELLIFRSKVWEEKFTFFTQLVAQFNAFTDAFFYNWVIKSNTRSTHHPSTAQQQSVDVIQSEVVMLISLVECCSAAVDDDGVRRSSSVSVIKEIHWVDTKPVVVCRSIVSLLSLSISSRVTSCQPVHSQHSLSSSLARHKMSRMKIATGRRLVGGEELMRLSNVNETLTSSIGVRAKEAKEKFIE